MAKKIPIAAAKVLAKKFGYDQVVILARKVSDPEDRGGWAACSYGKDEAHCQAAGKIVNAFAGLEEGRLKITRKPRGFDV